MKYYIGIDPGVKGCISIVDETGKFIESFFLLKNAKNVDAVEISNTLLNLSKYEDNCHVIIENIHAIFGSSAKGTFNFGFIAGLIEGVIATIGLPYTKVNPKIWQKEMFRGVNVITKPSITGKTQVIDTKKMSFLASHRIFPTVDLRRTNKCKNEDDNFSDSLLIAEYGRRMNF
jgi:hypothetical protein